MPQDNSPRNQIQAKSKFLKDMSHEIQGTMKEILSKSDLLRQSSLNEAQTEYLDAINSSACKLSWVVNDILDFSQMESGHIELQSIEFNLEYLINDVFKKTVNQKKDHPVDTYIDLDKDVPRHLIGDPTRLRQILVNLLSNAFKFTLKGEIGVIVRQEGRVEEKDRQNSHVPLKIVVKDTGSGMSQAKLQTIFDFDCQSEPSRSWEFGGTGLGLVICKLVIEAMGGTITAESTEGQGSTFTVRVAFQKGTLPKDRKVYPLTKNELVGKKAIIVDDNEIARKILKKCCDTMGIETVLITGSPKAVLNRLDDLSENDAVPDLILCDIMMPEMDGYELVRKVHGNPKYKNIKSIAVTSAVHVGSARSAQESGFSGFLPKPVFLDELAKVITTVLGDNREEKTIITRHMAEELKFKGTNVLVIGTQGFDQKLLEECLETMECEREFISTGKAGIERISEKIYDVCLVDLSVFSGEGAEVVRTMKNISRNMPVVMLLTAEQGGRRSECLDAGADDFIIKPVDMIGLKRIIKRYGKN